MLCLGIYTYIPDLKLHKNVFKSGKKERKTKAEKLTQLTKVVKGQLCFSYIKLKTSAFKQLR